MIFKLSYKKLMECGIHGQENNFGISASRLIWDFFNTYDINGKIN